jgi:hypothetical protein
VILYDTYIVPYLSIGINFLSESYLCMTLIRLYIFVYFCCYTGSPKVVISLQIVFPRKNRKRDNVSGVSRFTGVPGFSGVSGVQVSRVKNVKSEKCQE